jgi:hypothetical protein
MKLPKPTAVRGRKSASPKRPTEGTQRRTPLQLNGADSPEVRRRARRALPEEPVAGDWRDLPPPTRDRPPPPNGEPIYPAEELTPPIVPRREPELLPTRKLGFFERLGFGRGRRGE